MKRSSDWGGKVRTASWGRRWVCRGFWSWRSLRTRRVCYGRQRLWRCSRWRVGYSAQARRIAEFGRKLDGQKDAVRPGDLMQLEASACGFRGALSGLAGFLSFTVWPFYVCLAGLAIGLGSTIAKPSIPVPAPMVHTPTGYAQQGMPLSSPSGLPSKFGRSTPPLSKSLTPHLQANPGAVPARSGPLQSAPNTAMPHGPSPTPKILASPMTQTVSGPAPATPVSVPIMRTAIPSAISPASVPAAVTPLPASTPASPPSPVQATTPPAGMGK
jgi:hypothetical protein